MFHHHLHTSSVQDITDGTCSTDAPHPEGCGCHACVEVNGEIGTVISGAAGDIAPTILIKSPGIPQLNSLNEVSDDSIPGDATTTASISVGGSVTSDLDVAGDRDWFEISLTSGTSYVFDLEGSGANPVSDTILRLYDSGGNLVAQDDDGGAGFYSKLAYYASSGGTYYLEAAAFNDAGTGDYTLSAAEQTVDGVLPVPSVQGTAGLLGSDQTQIGFYFGDSGTLSTYGAALASTSHAAWTGEENWTNTEKDIVREALDFIETLIDVTFVETTVQGDAALDFIKNDDSGSLGTAGSLTYSSGYRESTVRMNHTISDRWLNGKEQGGQGYETLIHEIGHALGLGHTHDTGLGSGILLGMSGFSAFSGGALGFNDPINSIMAYRDGWAAEGTSTQAYGNRGNFGAWDQQALINLYGAAATTSPTNDTYTLPTTSAQGTFFHTIRDTDGTDQISAGSAALDAIIDLRAATLDDVVETSGGPVSFFDNGSGGVIPGGFTIAAGTVIENATGGTGDDDITGNAAANQLMGMDGADTLKGGDGDDTLEGGAGADSLLGGADNDSASYASSDARVEVDLSAMSAAGGHAAGDTLDSIEGLIGSGFNDLLVGSVAANVISGGGEADNINGLAGDDVLMGDAGNDQISGANDNDTVDGGADDDLLYGNGGLDSLLGGTGLDTIFGGTDDDHLDGGANGDELSGQGGNDTLLGDTGEDILRGGSGDDSIEGGANNDFIYGNGNNDTLAGGEGNDTLQGAAGSDDLSGDAGDDVLTGGIGGDRLDGGTGNDVMNGGGTDGARDTFVFLLGYEQDRINAFDQAGTDRIELDEDLWLGTNPGGLTEQQVVDTFGALNGTGTILTLDFGGGDILEVQNAGGIDETSLGADILIV